MSDEPRLGNDDGAPPPEAPLSIPDRLDAVLGTMFGEPMLRPVLFVILAHVAAFLAPALLVGLRDRNLLGMAAVAAMIVSSGAGVARDWREGRLRVLTGFILCAWALGAVFAYFGHRYGVL